MSTRGGVQGWPSIGHVRPTSATLWLNSANAFQLWSKLGHAGGAKTGGIRPNSANLGRIPAESRLLGQLVDNCWTTLRQLRSPPGATFQGTRGAKNCWVPFGSSRRHARPLKDAVIMSSSRSGACPGAAWSRVGISARIPETTETGCPARPRAELG